MILQFEMTIIDVGSPDSNLPTKHNSWPSGFQGDVDSTTGAYHRDYWRLLNTGMLLTIAGIFRTDLTHLPGNLPFLLSDTPYHQPSADLRTT